MTKFRTRAAVAVSNWILNTFAEEEYNERLEYTYILGLEALNKKESMIS